MFDVICDPQPTPFQGVLLPYVDLVLTSVLKVLTTLGNSNVVAHDRVTMGFQSFEESCITWTVMLQCKFKQIDFRFLISSISMVQGTRGLFIWIAPIAKDQENNQGLLNIEAKRYFICIKFTPYIIVTILL